jgi:hypothetical protein
MIGAKKFKRGDLYYWGAISGLVILILCLKHVVFYEPTGAMYFFDELIYKRNALLVSGNAFTWM